MATKPTAEQLARESGEAIANAIADNLERVILRLVDSIATLQAEQAELRDELHTLSQSHDALVRLVQVHGNALGKMTLGRYPS